MAVRDFTCGNRLSNKLNISRLRGEMSHATAHLKLPNLGSFEGWGKETLLACFHD